MEVRQRLWPFRTTSVGIDFSECRCSIFHIRAVVSSEHVAKRVRDGLHLSIFNSPSCPLFQRQIQQRMLRFTDIPESLNGFSSVQRDNVNYTITSATCKRRVINPVNI